MSQGLRVVHYLNQFFGGLGGEEKADSAPQAVNGPVGPGKAIINVLGDRGNVESTVICGDNYFADNEKEALEEVLSLVRACEPDILIAGPAFNAGRYGVACGQLCKAVNEKLGIPAITAMYEENPGTDLYREDVFIVKTDESVKGMNDAISKMVNIGLRLVTDEPLGRAADEGYFSRGIIKNEFRDRNAAERAVEMVLARIKGDPFEPELELPKFEHVKPAVLEKDLATATVALATDGGLVPKGNPDKMESSRSTRFAVYSIEGLATLRPEEFEANHMGFDTDQVNEDPNRLVPLDVLRELEKEGVIGKVHEKVYTTAGVATSLKNAEIIAQGIAEEMKAGGVDAVILTSTWGTSTRCGAVITKELERSGFPTAQISTMTPIALMVGANRVIPGAGILHPVGNADLDPPEEKRLRRVIVQRALEALRKDIQEQELFERSA